MGDVVVLRCFFFFFSSRRRHTRCLSDWSSDVCSSDLLRFSLHGSQLAGGLAAALACHFAAEGGGRQCTGGHSQLNSSSTAKSFLYRRLDRQIISCTLARMGPMCFHSLSGTAGDTIHLKKDLRELVLSLFLPFGL